uniref:Uncharacterized protein n=1 Tax=Schizaphis graminum TaxID=13262 RepID=A0A2S2PEC7_SCHGA
MNALSIGWNGYTSLFDYFNWYYRVLVENNYRANVTIINICVNQYRKMIVNHVYTYFQSEINNCEDCRKKRKEIMLLIGCLLFNIESLEDVESWLKIFSMRDKCNFNQQLSNM